MTPPDVATPAPPVQEEGSRVGYLDRVSATESARAYKARIVEFLGLRPGDHVLDVGCGTGDDARALAAVVGAGGRAVGIDVDPRMVAEAWRRSAAESLPVEFRLGDVHRLAFAEATFAGCRADRVFQHLEDPDRALDEMGRVTAPGGRIVVGDVDWGTLAVDSPDRELTRRVVAFTDGRWARQGWAGRRLRGLFRRHGLREVSVHAASVVLTDLALADQLWNLRRIVQQARDEGALSAAEAEGWWAGLERAQATGEFFGAVTGFVARGIR